ncbi:hypothetical protein KIPB_013905 [Kipferlia bialata]|uniref:Uncharacterized protein n=1 Tax=Kipferlia bialata TaxID=797122 RepID=A0A9K3GQM1_9EUKA|nr:hypothetical protein KIPB_013905 [Kipferlia bialata]|eukprot:g13905.t1
MLSAPSASEPFFSRRQGTTTCCVSPRPLCPLRQSLILSPSHPPQPAGQSPPPSIYDQNRYQDLQLQVMASLPPPDTLVANGMVPRAISDRRKAKEAVGQQIVDMTE